MDNDRFLEIEASKEFLQSALHNSGVAISQQDLDLRYTRFFNTHPGIPQTDLIGKTDKDWLPPNEAAKLTQIKRRALKGKKGIREIFKSTLGSGGYGKIYYNDMRVEPIIVDGKVAGIYTVTIDVTELQNSLNKIEEMNGRLLKHMYTQLGD